MEQQRTPLNAGRRIPEKGWFNRKREPGYKKYFVERLLEKNPRNKEMAAVLRTIDFDCIRELLVPHAVRSGIDANTMNFVYPEDVFDDGPQVDNSGSYVPTANVILLPFEDLKDVAGIHNTDLRSVVTKSIVHEEIHASALVACEGGNPISLQFQVGYAKDKNFRKSVYNGINEGVVEELCVRTLNENAKLLGVENKYTTYLGNRMFVNALVRALSRDAGLPQDVVWNGFVRGLYEGLDLDAEPELLETFKKFIGTASVQALKNESDIHPERVTELAREYVAEMMQKSTNSGLWPRIKQLFM